ncbi:hypothetical protein Y032_0549g3295 [Ancylostoma ceylanicum]|uniref:Uncharacterized protein n=1 Tax=Ancylostoma ceylanicum TaxID=53326 RepID=A0A016WSH5_9BILA|nr:hypothetical protein Y032_0549g3295 [Ancylostoma ceylanicum]
METGEEVSISCCDGCFLRSRRVPSRSQPQVRDYSHEMHRCIDLQILKWFEFSVLKRASTMDSTAHVTIPEWNSLDFDHGHGHDLGFGHHFPGFHSFWGGWDDFPFKHRKAAKKAAHKHRGAHKKN